MIDSWFPLTDWRGALGRAKPLLSASAELKPPQVISAVNAPLIVTALMGSEDFAWADQLRRTHFPPERNFIPAHISLFHHLPPSRLDDLLAILRRECAAAQPRTRLASVMSLGRGVAFRVESEDLLEIRQRIADEFHGQLIPQDQHVPRLHITVQNKVAPPVAKSLHDSLSSAFWPRPLTIIGLAAWHYLGGPWKLAGQAKFRGVRAL